MKGWCITNCSNAAVADGADASLLVGSLGTFREAAQTATRQALAALDGARPVLALVLADLAWQMLFEAQPGADIAAVQETLGPDVSLAGGYTLGQIVPAAKGTPQFLNQHMAVVIFGDPTAKERNRLPKKRGAGRVFYTPDLGQDSH